MFDKILIANRGEIASRLVKACQDLGVRCAIVYSEADAGAPWVRLADEAYPLAGQSARETYLNQEAIFRVARQCAADALHPGYGFLSENPDFAAACDAHGITFIGPSPVSMRRLGNKARARAVAREAGVPVVPGLDGAGKTGQELLEAATAIGFPVLIKASAGGGGKGMRIVASPAGFADALHQARNEASSSFGDDHILIEKYFATIHHVEVQLLGDRHGKLLHLFERECSVQRRYQKIIEESPAPAVTGDAQRQEIAAAAVRLAAAAGYENAGTVEFMVAEDGSFYFLEMNTRLQVEHPVTEMVTGLDLAAWQIRIAAGDPLPFAQADIRQRGHAIECRVYAEDPANGFLPSIGNVVAYRAPGRPGVRVDDGVEAGQAITAYYDPMLAKVIAWGQNRSEAIHKMERALREMVVLGIKTNIPYLLGILREPVFLSGNTTTAYLEEHMGGWSAQDEAGEAAWAAAAVLELLQGGGRQETLARDQAAGDDGSLGSDPWRELHNWRNVQA